MKRSKLDPIKDFIINLYINHQTGSDTIAALIHQNFGISIHGQSILNRLNIWGVPIRPQPCTTTETVFSQTNMELINGLLLGDGGLSKITKNINRNSAFSLGTIHEEYALFLQNNLPFYTRINTREAGQHTRKNGEIIQYKKSHKLSSNFDLSLTELRKKWYPDDIKRVPSDISLCPSTVLHWFLGDGHSTISKDGYVIVGFSTDAFTWTECEDLTERLKNIDSSLDFHVKWHRKNQPIIISQKQSSIKSLFEYIGDSPLECFRYKWKTSSRLVYEGWLSIEKYKSEIQQMRIDGSTYQYIADWYKSQTGQSTSGASVHNYLKKWETSKYNI